MFLAYSYGCGGEKPKERVVRRVLWCIDMILAYSYGCGGEKLKERVVRRVLWCIDMFLAWSLVAAVGENKCIRQA